MVAELKAPPDDAPHDAVDKAVEIAINGADPCRNGKLEGHVSFLSAATHPRENGETYDRALVALEPTKRPLVDGIDLAFKER